MMLKNKRINNILIFLVLVIWGGIFYKYSYKNANTTVAKPIITNEESIVFNTIDKKDFEIIELTRDPFLDRVVSKPKIRTKRVVRKQKTTKRKVSWPKVDYLGFIKKSNGKKMVLLKINNSFKKMQVGKRNSEEDFYISKVYKDSVYLKTGNQIKIIRK